MTATAVRPDTRRRLVVIAVPLVLLAVAALLRLPDLATRGTWDADQGHDMLVLRALVRDGVVPLLGPPTSIGDVHHGALYYFALSPAAFLTGGDSPLAVVALIALAGIAAVVVTWWLARAIAGPVAGVVAGLAMAVSTSAIEESTFIWNPNLIALWSAVALAGAWQAWSTGRPRWWLLAAAGTAMTMQSHVLGVTMLPIVGGLLVADARARPAGPARRRVWRYGLAGLVIIALSFTPLAIHELTTDFSEVNAALDYIRVGGDATTIEPLARLLIIGMRIVSWPLSGLFTDAPLAAVIAIVVVVGIVAWRSLAGSPRERQAAVWLGLGLAWTAFALTFLSPRLASDRAWAPERPLPRVRGPDGLRDCRDGRRGRSGAIARLGPPLTVVLVGAFVAWSAATWPPAVDPDGGFPAADRAATRILASAGTGEVTLRSLPAFKSTEAYAYPLIRAGAVVKADTGTGPIEATSGTIVVICDALCEPVIGAACGGPAEATVAPPDRFGEPVDRFEAAPGRTISVYRAAS